MKDFMGVYGTRQVDYKGRVVIPSKLLKTLEERCKDANLSDERDYIYLLYRGDKIFCYPPDVYIRKKKEYENMPEEDERRIKFFSNSYRLRIERGRKKKYGRIRLEQVIKENIRNTRVKFLGNYDCFLIIVDAQEQNIETKCSNSDQS